MLLFPCTRVCRVRRGHAWTNSLQFRKTSIWWNVYANSQLFTSSCVQFILETAISFLKHNTNTNAGTLSQGLRATTCHGWITSMSIVKKAFDSDIAIPTYQWKAIYRSNISRCEDHEDDHDEFFKTTKIYAIRHHASRRGRERGSTEMKQSIKLHWIMYGCWRIHNHMRITVLHKHWLSDTKESIKILMDDISTGSPPQQNKQDHQYFTRWMPVGQSPC